MKNGKYGKLEGIGTVSAQKLARIKVMKFTRFYFLYFVETLCINNKIYGISTIFFVNYFGSKLFQYSLYATLLAYHL